MLLRFAMLSLFALSANPVATDFHSLHFSSADGSDFDFQNLRGKAVLIVNTASGCGFAPQYDDLQKLYEKYQSRGLVILAFPSNDFGGQEPLDNQQITGSCRLNYGVTFPVLSKSHVKGKDANPVFKWLSAPETGGGIFRKPIWNFQKFLINKKGKLVKVYLPFFSPSSPKLSAKIEEILAE